MPGNGRQTTFSGEAEPREAATKRRLLRSAGTVGGLTLVSRVLGYLRDMAVAALLGTGPVNDAFQAAFQLPNALRRLASEGNLSAAFVPVFARISSQHDDGSVWRTAARFHTAILLIVGALALVGIVAAPVLVPLIYSGFASETGKLELTIRLTRFLFPYALFISGSAVLMAVLNARNRFAAAAFTPVLLNVAIVTAGAAAWWGGSDWPVAYLVVGVLVGGLVQWSFLMPFARRIGMRLFAWPRGSDPALREIGRLIVPRLFGVGIVQINIVVGQAIAGRLPGNGAVSALYFASRITELALGVFAVSVATVVLPSMSQQGATHDLAGMRRTLSFALRQVIAITLPAAVGLVLLRQEIVAVLFERELFDADSTALTALALSGYACGLAAVAAVRVTAPAFYAVRDTRTPVLVAAGAMVVNLLGCLALSGPYGVAGIALANSIAAVVSAAALLILLRARLGGFGGRRLVGSFVRLVAAAAIMGWVVSAVAAPAAAAGRTVGLAMTILVGLLTYAAALAVLGAAEIAELRDVLRRRRPGTLDDANTREGR